jgi:lipase maturation factor 1
LAFAPRRLRRLGFVLLTGLQALIAATGNYGFFNVLTIADNLWLLGDSSFVQTGRTNVRGKRPRLLQRALATVGALPIVAISGSLLVARLFSSARLPRSIERLHEAIAPLRSINPYGLFAVMTTKRPEIIIEGSNDGVRWLEYAFRYKPGDPKTPPRWAAPHQPRLDWQMWFAALGPPPAWFYKLLQRLLEASPDVLALLARDPFMGAAPKFVRARMYDYHFTDREERRRTGAWWRRELLGTYVPPVELGDPDRETLERSLAIAPPD